jgi:molecular chaperone GrpE (heat shock protein)
MSGTSVAPRLCRWPFFLADVLLVGLAAVFILHSTGPLTFGQGALCLASTVAGACFCAWPFLADNHAALRLREADALATTVTQIENLDQIKTQISGATAQWHGVQEQSRQTVAAAREITDRMKAQLSEFCAFLQKRHDDEREHLRLEVDKLRRGERDWLQSTVLILDHIFALHMAGARSGQPALAAQLDHFQAACRDTVRRLGLIGFAPAVNDEFDRQAHQLQEGAEPPGLPGRIAEVLALGFTFRGELVRKALVRIQPARDAAPPA